MKKEEIPQDNSALKAGRELCYAVDEEGKYVTAQSSGWDVKSAALNVAWEDIQERIKEAKAKVKRGELSPIGYYIELKMMDLKIVAAYTGFWKWQIKRHLQPSIFNKLSDKKLNKYAALFEVSLEELKDIKNDTTS